jgi:hypothetical protein
MRLAGGERRPRGVDQIMSAGRPVLRGQREHPRERPRHASGEGTVVVHRHADELRGELEQAGAALGLALRHEDKRLAIAPSHRHRVVLSLGEHLGGVLAQIRGAARGGADGWRGHVTMIFGTYSEVHCVRRTAMS